MPFPRATAAIATPRPNASSGHSRIVNGGLRSTEPAVESDAPEALLEPGSMIGPYRVIEQIGAGAMGRVMRAYDPRLDRDVAIKLLHPGARPVWIGHEARMMARLRHPNLVAIHDFEPDAAQPYLVMDLVAGRPLSDLLPDAAPLALDVALGILRQLCEGVQAMHDAGVVHLDLKPENVLLDESWHAIITDFGLARRPQLDRLRHLGGTPYFIAPEVWRDCADHVLLPRADVYALGLIAVWLLTGELPTPNDGTLDSLKKNKLEGKLVLPSTLRPELDPSFDAVVARALAVDPRERIASAAELWRELDEARAIVARPRKRLRIMIVDDDADFRALAGAIVRHVYDNALVVEHGNAESALDDLLVSPFDLLLLDLRMPRLNGFEVLAGLRAADSARPRPTVVVVSAHSGAADWRALSQIGADALVVKPVDPTVLAGALTRLVPVPCPGSSVPGTRARS